MDTPKPVNAAATAPAMQSLPLADEPRSGISWRLGSLFAGIGLIVIVGIVVPVFFIIPNLKNEETPKTPVPVPIAKVEPPKFAQPVVPPVDDVEKPPVPTEVPPPKVNEVPNPSPQPKETGSERPTTTPKTDPVVAKTDPGVARAALEFVEDKSFGRVPTEVAKVIEAVIPYQVRRIKVEQKESRKLQLAVSPAPNRRPSRLNTPAGRCNWQSASRMWAPK